MSARRVRAAAFVSLVAAFVLAASWPLIGLSAGFLYTDEMYGFRQADSAAEDGNRTYRLPYAHLVGRGFASMGSFGSGPSVQGGVTPVFVHLFAPSAGYGPFWAQLSIVGASLLLVVGVFVLGRVIAGPGPAFAAAAVVAAAPPVLFWSTFFMSNIPAAAFFVLSMAALGMFVKTERIPWVLLSTLLMFVTVGMRRDAIGLALPFTAVVAIYALKRPALWAVLAGAAYGFIASYRYAVGRDPNFPGMLLFHPREVPWVIDSILTRYEAYNDDGFSFDVLRLNLDRFVFDLYPMLAIVGALGLVLVRYRRSKEAVLGAGLILAALAYVGVALTINPNWGADPPAIMSSVVRYALVVPIVLGLFAGLFVWRAFEGFEGRRRTAFATLAVLCLVVPGVVQATAMEPGLVWLREQRSWRHEYNEQVALFPEDAYLIGDEASKFVTSRLVLTPFNTGRPVEPALLRAIDRLNTSANLTGYIHYDSYQGDWSGRLGEMITDKHHTTIESGIGRFLIVHRTNTTLANIGILGHRHWTSTPDNYLATLVNYSYFRPTPILADQLVEAPSPGVLVQFTVLDHDLREHEAGYVNAPGAPNDIHVTHRWLGTGTGGWRTESFFVPADAVVNGPFYLSDGLILRDLNITALPGAIAR